MQKKILAVLTGLLTMTTAVCSATVSTASIALDGVSPGSSVAAAKQKLGTPTQNGDKLFFPNGIVVEIADHNPDVIEEITTRSAGATPAGVHVGMNESILAETYGSADKIDREHDDTEYTYYSTDNTQKLEFKVVNGKIVKIKCELR